MKIDKGKDITISGYRIIKKIIVYSKKNRGNKTKKKIFD